MEAVAPRSTRSHCGSVPSFDAHLVLVRLPSTAALAGYDDDSVDDAVAPLPCDSSVSGPPPPVTVTPSDTVFVPPVMVIVAEPGDAVVAAATVTVEVPPAGTDVGE